MLIITPGAEEVQEIQYTTTILRIFASFFWLLRGLFSEKVGGGKGFIMQPRSQGFFW